MNFDIGDLIFYIKEHMNLDSCRVKAINKFCWELSTTAGLGTFIFDLVFYNKSSILIKLEDNANNTTYVIKYFFEEQNIVYEMSRYDDWYDDLSEYKKLTITKFIKSEEEYFQQSTVEELPTFLEVKKLMNLLYYLEELNKFIVNTENCYNTVHNIILYDNPSLKLFFNKI